MRSVLRMAGVVAVIGLGTPGVAVAQGQPADTPRQVYERACTACHGPDGRGADRSAVGFDLALPDFTDCSFATREPDGDWLAVAHEGGPARGFDKKMPAFDEALTPDELQLAVDHLRGFCTDAAWPRGELNLPRPFVTEKAYPEDEMVLTTVIDAEGAGAVTNEIVYEKRFGALSQIEIAMPVAATGRRGGRWSGGLGDLAIGVKQALYHSLRRGSIVSVAGEVVLPTGDEDEGFGKGTPVVETFASFGQLFPADAFMHLQGGIELPTDTDKAAREAFWRVVFGKTITQGPFGRSWSPMLEVLGARELLDGEAPQWDVLPQMQISLSTRQHVLANVGVRIPVTDADRRTTQVLVYVLWDWYDGGFFEGW